MSFIRLTWIRQIYGFFLRWQGFYPISLLTYVPLSRLVLQPKTTHALFLPPLQGVFFECRCPGYSVCYFGVRIGWGMGWHFSIAPALRVGGPMGGVSPVNKGVWGGGFFTRRAAPRERAVIIDFASNRLNINVYRLNIVNPVIGHLVINDFALSGGGKAL